MRIFLVVVFVSFAVALPTCRLDVWLRPGCLQSANVSYAPVIYNGNCSMVHGDPSGSAYQLSIDVERKTVQNFSVFASKTCAPVDLLYFISPGTRLGQCASLSFVITPGRNVTIGSLLISCFDA